MRWDGERGNQKISASFQMKRRRFLTAVFTTPGIIRGNRSRRRTGEIEYSHFDFKSNDYMGSFNLEEVANQYLTSAYTDTGEALRIDIPEGDHYGARMVFNTEDNWDSQCEELHARYWVYIPEDIDITQQLKLLLIGNRGSQGWGGRKSDGTDGWSTRVALHDRRRSGYGIEFYTYHADMANQYGDHNEWGCKIPRGEWSRIDFYVKMNTPGDHNGEILGLLNNTHLSGRSGLKFREEGYSEFSINEFELLVYHGGSSPSPKDNYIVINHVEIWKDKNKIL
ncbi:polysaccharide lyase [Natrialbaceae archaeon A-CW1-1]